MHDHYQPGQLAFISDKIKEIGIGMFRSETNSELQLPNNIVRIIKVEADGTLWFFTSCIGFQAENIERSFFAHLEFHKRGTDCRIEINGIGNIAENKEDLFELSNYSKGTAERLLLVKLKIMQAEYFESSPLTNLSVTEKIKSVINHLFMPPETKIFRFS